MQWYVACTRVANGLVDRIQELATNLPALLVNFVYSTMTFDSPTS